MQSNYTPTFSLSKLTTTIASHFRIRGDRQKQAPDYHMGLFGYFPIWLVLNDRGPF